MVLVSASLILPSASATAARLLLASFALLLASAALLLASAILVQRSDAGYSHATLGTHYNNTNDCNRDYGHQPTGIPDGKMRHPRLELRCGCLVPSTRGMWDSRSQTQNGRTLTPGRFAALKRRIFYLASGMQSSALAFVESVKSGEGVETFGASGRSKTDVSSEIRLDVLS